MSSGLVYYVIDTETTGLLPKMHEMCEYSIIRCSDRVQLSRQIKVDNPRNASADALAVTGKTIEDLSKGISKVAAIRDLHDFVEQDGLTSAHRCLIAHNASFDKRFLHHLWDKHEFSFPFDCWLDTIPMCKRLAAQIGQPKAKVKLDLAMDLFGLKKMAGLHTAKGDSRNTYILWKHLMDSGVEYVDLIKVFPHRKTEVFTTEDMDDFE